MLLYQTTSWANLPMNSRFLGLTSAVTSALTNRVRTARFSWSLTLSIPPSTEVSSSWSSSSFWSCWPYYASDLMTRSNYKLFRSCGYRVVTWWGSQGRTLRVSVNSFLWHFHTRITSSCTSIILSQVGVKQGRSSPRLRRSSMKCFRPSFAFKI